MAGLQRTFLCGMWKKCQRNRSCDIKKVFYNVEISECSNNMDVCTCNIKDVIKALKRNSEPEWKEKVLDKVNPIATNNLNCLLVWKGV